VLDGGAHWLNLANTTEPFMCGGDAAFLSNYSDHLLLMTCKICNIQLSSRIVKFYLFFKITVLVCFVISLPVW